tara:strand:+ start:6245 stop:6784 length:540 start_codon:yes stop_codon:yes gene_type:complete
LGEKIKFNTLGDGEGGPPIFLERDKFSYAGKFIGKDTGKILAKNGERIIAALSFSGDRNDKDIVWIRYVVVEKNLRGKGIGPKLLSYAVESLMGRVKLVKIATNNVFAYRALYKSGFEYTGKKTGILELVLECPSTQTRERYLEGIEAFRSVKSLTDEEVEFVSKEDIKNMPTKTLFSF